MNSGCQIIVSDGSIISFFCFCRRSMAQPFQQSSIVIPVHPRECGQFHFCTVFPALTVYYLRFEYVDGAICSSLHTGPTPYSLRSLSSSGITFSRGGRTPPSQNKRKPGEGYRYCGAVHDFHVPALSDADVQRW